MKQGTRLGWYIILWMMVRGTGIVVPYALEYARVLCTLIHSSFNTQLSPSSSHSLPSKACPRCCEQGTTIIPEEPSKSQSSCFIFSPVIIQLEIRWANYKSSCGFKFKMWFFIRLVILPWLKVRSLRVKAVYFNNPARDSLPNCRNWYHKMAVFNLFASDYATNCGELAVVDICCRATKSLFLCRHHLSNGWWDSIGDTGI